MRSAHEVAITLIDGPAPRGSVSSELASGSLTGVKTTFEPGELNELVNKGGSRPPTPDDVSITADGRRLDTPEKLIAWVHEFNASRADEPAG